MAITTVVGIVSVDSKVMGMTRSAAKNGRTFGCLVCKQPFAVGERIKWQHGTDENGAKGHCTIHAQCNWADRPRSLKTAAGTVIETVNGVAVAPPTAQYVTTSGEAVASAKPARTAKPRNSAVSTRPMPAATVADTKYDELAARVDTLAAMMVTLLTKMAEAEERAAPPAPKVRKVKAS